VLPEEECQPILDRLLRLLKPGGKAYISVRRDPFKEGVTSKGTFQRKAFLDLPVLCKNSRYCIYEMTKS
jgi:hypothetical protein